MSARDELPEQLRAGLRELAGERLDELIREAHAEARAAVKARLRDELERELLARASERLARQDPPRETNTNTKTNPAEGLWVYCVAGAAHPGVGAGVEGVASGRRPRIVRSDRLSALVSEVPLDEFGSDGLRRNLNDLGWLEQTARAHETALDAALAGGAVVPMRVCTIYRGEDHVREALRERHAAFSEALEWLDGRTEWGVKVVASREHAEGAARSASAPPPDEQDGGGTYLARKQHERRSREHADALLDEVVRECHARLEEWASASRLLPAQRRELAGYEGEMVLNGTYLVDDDRVDSFAHVVDELREQYGARGLAFDLTGPWPAYHFVGRLEAMEDVVP